ncbi:MAG: protease HtpX [Bdellovibrionales bacterium]|nr:protease HtpX [Bdellovibrionales bacterium]
MSLQTISIWSKRILFFFATNFLVVSSLFLVASFLMNHFQIEVEGFTFYLIFYTIIGMGGALISLWSSKWMAIRGMGVQVISENSSDSRERDLVQKVNHLSVKAGLPVKPAVGIYKSNEVNAFATGPSKKNSLVAVSTGLLDHMNEHETEGVLAHEVAHIANGDMVTMSLIQGVVNVMVFLIADLLAQVVVKKVLNRGRNWFIEYMIRQVFVTILYIPGSMLVCFFSRWREYRADHGGARFAGRDKMISALRSLSQITQMRSHNKKEYSYLMINNKSSKSLMRRLFSTHPPIEDRIKRLQSSLA